MEQHDFRLPSSKFIYKCIDLDSLSYLSKSSACVKFWPCGCGRRLRLIGSVVGLCRLIPFLIVGFSEYFVLLRSLSLGVNSIVLRFQFLFCRFRSVCLMHIFFLPSTMHSDPSSLSLRFSFLLLLLCFALISLLLFFFSLLLPLPFTPLLPLPCHSHFYFLLLPSHVQILLPLPINLLVQFLLFIPPPFASTLVSLNLSFLSLLTLPYQYYSLACSCSLTHPLLLIPSFLSLSTFIILSCSVPSFTPSPLVSARHSR